MDIVNELYQLIAPYFMDRAFDWIYENKKAVRNKEEFNKKLVEITERYKCSDENTYDVLCKIIYETRIVQDILYYCTNLSAQKKSIEDKVSEYLDELSSKKDFKIITTVRQNIRNFFEELFNNAINIFLVPDDKSIKQLLNIIYYYKLELNIQNERNAESLKSYFAEFNEKMQSLINTSKYLVWTDPAIVKARIFDSMLKPIEIPSYDFIYSKCLRSNEKYCNLILERDLDNHTGEIPAALYYIWEEFITGQQWHKAIEEKVLDIKYSLEYDDFETDQLVNIDLNSNYNQIRKKLNDFCDSVFLMINERQKKDAHHYYSELRGSVKAFQKYLKESTYRRCFFLTGRIGSGKTNFIYQLLTRKEFRQDSRKLYQYLYLEIEHSDWFNAPLLTIILKKLNGLTQLQYEELEDYISIFEQKQIRLIVIIDGLQNFLSRDVRFKEELIKGISESTNFHSLYWLITIRESDLDLLDMDSDFWNLYTAKEVDSSNWISIDRWNDESEVTISILNNSLIKKGITFSNPELIKKMELKGFPYKILNPLTAWIINDNSEKIDILNASDLIYMDFIKEFENKRMKILHEILEVIDKSGYAMRNPRILTLFINNLAYYFVYNNKDSYQKNALAKVLTSNITEAVIDNAFLALEKGYLLEKCDDMLTEKVKRSFEIFWNYKMALLIHERDELKTFDDFLSQQKEQILLYKDVIEFLILIMDEKLFINESNQPVDLQTLEYAYTSSLWKAGILASKNMKKLTAELLLQRKLPENINIFSVIYFLKYVTDDIIPPDVKIKALQPYYKLLTGQITYTKNMIDNLLGHMMDIDMLYRAILNFNGCEVLGITDYLAELCVKNLLRLHNDEFNKVANSMIEFSEQNKAVINASNKDGENNKEYFSYYFFQSLYCKFCKALYLKYGVKAYDLLKSIKWYDLQGSIKEKYKLWMRKAANLEYGRWYQSFQTHDYINLISRLSESFEISDWINALYMIKHSVPQKQKFTYFIDDDFIPILEKLVKKSGMREEITRKDNSSFIQDNFEHYDYDLLVNYKKYIGKANFVKPM